MSMTSKPKIITNKNITKFINYNEDLCDDYKDKCLMISWNCKNKILDMKMERERHVECGYKTSHLWVYKLIEVSGWKKGEKLYGFLKSNADGYFNVWFSKNRDDVARVDLIIDEDGFVVRQFKQCYSHKEDDENDIHKYYMVRCPCVYNDKQCVPITLKEL